MEIEAEHNSFFWEDVECTKRTMTEFEWQVANAF